MIDPDKVQSYDFAQEHETPQTALKPQLTEEDLSGIDFDENTTQKNFVHTGLRKADIQKQFEQLNLDETRRNASIMQELQALRELQYPERYPARRAK